MLRINGINFISNSQRKDDKPSPLFSLFSDGKFRDVFSLIAAHSSPLDIVNVKRTCNSANTSTNILLDASFNNPDMLLKILSKLDKIQISRLLQQYFSDHSPYYKKLEENALNVTSPAAYACYALCAKPNKLNMDILNETIIWLEENHAAPHIINSLEVIYEYGHKHEDLDEYEFKTFLAARTDAYLNLQDCKLRNMIFNGIDMRGANFQHADLSGSTLNEARLDYTNFNYASLKSIFARQASFRHANFQFTQMTDANIWGSDFSGADMRYSTLNSANMYEAVLINAQLLGSTLKNARLNNANARNTDFTGCDLTLTNFQFANLVNANLTRTKLLGTIFFCCNLTNAKLPGKAHNSLFMLLSTAPDNLDAEPPKKLRRR